MFRIVGAHALAQLQTRRNFRKMFFSVWRVSSSSREMRKCFWTKLKILQKTVVFPCFSGFGFAQKCFRRKIITYSESAWETASKNVRFISFSKKNIFDKNPRQGFPLKDILSKNIFFWSSLFFHQPVFLSSRKSCSYEKNVVLRK